MVDSPTLAAALPGRFVWVPWEESLLADHAEVKFQSFRHEIDAYVFPCLGDRYGCRRLMREIRRKPGFLPGATWLIACPEGYVATVQGVMDLGPIGAIQNLGVIPSYRGIGLGRALVHRALGWISRGRTAPGLPGSHRREQRRRPALPQPRLPPGQDTLQGGRRVKGRGEWRVASSSGSERRGIKSSKRSVASSL